VVVGDVILSTIEDYENTHPKRLPYYTLLFYGAVGLIEIARELPAPCTRAIAIVQQAATAMIHVLERS
jgi:hypothetical protein